MNANLWKLVILIEKNKMKPDNRVKPEMYENDQAINGSKIVDTFL